MRGTREHLDELSRLHRIGNVEERRTVFRQAFATLAGAASELVPVPLEGIDPTALREGIRVALDAGLFDDLAWLAPEHAAAAIYELAAALPAGEEKRELGRRVLRALYEGNAATFTMVATQLASGSRRGLSGSPMRARVALALDLPIGSGVRADALALALIARKDLAEEWLVGPSTGSLPSRRLAARLLERAARAAAQRAAAGDEGTLRVFDRLSVQQASARLLADREPLVWRHVATARGLLAQAIPRFAAEIEESLNPSLTPFEWRRAATSLAATIAVDPERALRRCELLLASETMQRDPGIAGAMVLGLARAAEAEPVAADELLTRLVRAGGLETIEALIEVRNERVGGELGEWAAHLALARLREAAISHTEGDDGREALLRALESELRPRDAREPATPTLRELLEDAKATFVERDARTAYARAAQVLDEVEERLRCLEESPETTRDGRIAAFIRLRELDVALLETSSLVDLLMLGRRADEKGPSQAARALDAVFARLTAYLTQRERAAIVKAGAVEHPTLRMRRLRTLLHLVDADGSHTDERTPELRERRIETARLLLRRIRDDAPSPLRRIVAASVARACDALLREEIGELSDVLIAIASHVKTEHDFGIIAEASMVPECADALRAYASIAERTAGPAQMTDARARAGLDALREFVAYLPGAGSPRVEAMRRALWNYAEALHVISEASSLAELAGEVEGGQGSLLLPLADAADALARVVAGARRRLGETPSGESPNARPSLQVVDIAVLHAARAGADLHAVGDTGASFDLGALAEAISSAIEALREDLPFHLAEVAANVLAGIVTLPAHAARRSRPPRAISRAREATLPAWMPPSRTIGGFYVLRALGSGAVGSVFVARRSEERHDEKAPKFALKVPEYGGSAARTLSESEFLQLFREEAGALLAVPPHENLAKLVTFDVGAKPKPILVMELVEGPTLERLVETDALDMERAIRVLDGIAAGLGAMHDAGVGHLDLKPSNVILRVSDGPGPALETPVLVDFGLAGRKLRPGCATTSYGAPEIWGLLPKGVVPRPMPADVYAYACLAYEVLTGRTLFLGPTDLATITAHLQHDGDLPSLDALLALDRRIAPFVETLRRALRQDPRKRGSIADLRAALREVAPVLTALRWPLPVPALAA
jgi:hypothetical protein